MTERIKCIEYLLEKLDGGLYIHCDFFRMVPGMKPETASRRLREWRELYLGEHFNKKLWIYGYTAVAGHMWKFQRDFVNWLRKQVKAAYRL